MAGRGAWIVGEGLLTRLCLCLQVVEYRMREQAGPSSSTGTPPTPPFTEVHLKSNRDPYKIASKDLKGMWCRTTKIAVLRTSHMCGPTFGRALLSYAWDQITDAHKAEVAIMITQEAVTGYFTERRAHEAAAAAAAAQAAGTPAKPAGCLSGVEVNLDLFGGSTDFEVVRDGLDARVVVRDGMSYVEYDGVEAALLTAFKVFEPTPEGVDEVSCKPRCSLSPIWVPDVLTTCSVYAATAAARGREGRRNRDQGRSRRRRGQGRAAGRQARFVVVQGRGQRRPQQPGQPGIPGRVRQGKLPQHLRAEPHGRWLAGEHVKEFRRGTSLMSYGSLRNFPIFLRRWGWSSHWWPRATPTL